MELKLSSYQLPEKITFNYEELRAELIEKTAMYNSLVYTDDQIKDAKSDKANLNKLKKALNDERIRLEKEYLVPFNDFKDKINEIIKIIDEPIGVIDTQVKNYENAQKDKKKASIEELFNSKAKPEFLKLSQIWDEKWLNASTSMKQVESTIDNELVRIDNELNTIEQLGDYSFEARQMYEATLSLTQAIAEGQRLAAIQKAKVEAEERKKQAELLAQQEAEKKAAELAEISNEAIEEEINEIVEAVSEQTFKVSFECEMTQKQAELLKQFFIDNGIKFKAI